MIIRWQVLGYRHCSPKLLGCHNLSIPPFHRSNWERKPSLSVYMYYKIIPTSSTLFFLVCLRWLSKQDWLKLRCISNIYKLLELATNQSWNICLVRFGVNLCPVEVWYKTQTPYSPHIYCLTCIPLTVIAILSCDLETNDYSNEASVKDTICTT